MNAEQLQNEFLDSQKTWSEKYSLEKFVLPNPQLEAIQSLSTVPRERNMIFV